MPIESVNGLKLHFQRQGDDGPDAILIHGVTGDQSIWMYGTALSAMSSRAPVPFAFTIMIRVAGFPCGDETRNAMRLPSGDQVGMPGVRPAGACQIVVSAVCPTGITRTSDVVA